MKPKFFSEKDRISLLRCLSIVLTFHHSWIAPLWKLNYHIWYSITVVLLIMTVLDMAFGNFSFVGNFNFITIIIELASSAIVCHGTEIYLSRHRAVQYTRDRYWYLILVYMAIIMIWLNLFIDDLYWENGMTALIYLGGRAYLEKRSN